MMTQKMTERFERTSAKDAHWRIDEIQEVLGGLTEVVDNHGKDLNSIKQTGRAIKTSLYTLAFVIASSEIGFIDVVRKLIGI